MRYDAEHKERTRERVLKEAAKAIRAQGPHRIGVAQVMAKAGLTHGGFYAHFASKDELVAASIGQMFKDSAGRFAAETDADSPARGLARYIDFYLSARHRDSRGSGCPLPYLSADAPRLTVAAREAFAAGAAWLKARIADKLEALGVADTETQASSLLSELVGALSLARAEPDPSRSDAILANSRSALKTRFHLEDAQ